MKNTVLSRDIHKEDCDTGFAKRKITLVSEPRSTKFQSYLLKAKLGAKWVIAFSKVWAWWLQKAAESDGSRTTAWSNMNGPVKTCKVVLLCNSWLSSAQPLTSSVVWRRVGGSKEAVNASEIMREQHGVRERLGKKSYICYQPASDPVKVTPFLWSQFPSHLRWKTDSTAWR